MVLNFKKWIEEENISSFDSETHIYKNPTSSDIKEMLKNKIKDVRYIIDSKNRSVYVWDANKYIHFDGFRLLVKKGFLPSTIPNEYTPDFYNEFLTGTAIISNGEIVHKESDSLDWVEDFFSKPREKWNKKITDLFVFIKNDIKSLLIKYKFANEYIKGCTGPDSSLIKIKNMVDKMEK